MTTTELSEMGTLAFEKPRNGKPSSAVAEGGLTLRAYQETAVRNLRAGLAEGVLRQILCSPTGSGKTEMGMAIVRGAIAKKRRVAFLCNRVHLVEQTSRRFARAGIWHGIIQGENTSRLYENVLVASIQTVARRGIPDVDLLLIDEAHSVAGSKDYRKVIENCKGKPVIGLSATPYSKGLGKHYDELGGALFQDMVVAATIKNLIDDGFLVDCDVYAPSEPDLSNVRVTAGDYNEKDLGEAVDKPTLIGDIVQNWIKLAPNTSTVCFATNIPHSKHICEQFRLAGVKAEHIDCYTNDVERAAILGRVASGETMVICNVGILCEGWDFPACKTLILARPTKSLIRYLQMAGRVLRPFQGKEKALILDHSGTVKRLGFPTDEFPMELDDGKPKKSSGSEKEKKEKLPEPCPSCTYLKPAKVHKCPVCGFAPERQSTVEHAPGELHRLEKKGKKTNVLADMPKQELYSQLLSIKNERGYSDGWCSHQYREVYGFWPRGLQDVCAEPSFAVRSYVQSKLIRYSKGKAKEGHRAND